MKINHSKTLIKLLENKYLQEKNIINNIFFNVGDLVQIIYKNYNEQQKKIQKIEGLIIGINNVNLNKTFTIKYILQGIGIEQIFFFNSPNIIKIFILKSYKIRRAKLYYYNNNYKKLLKIKKI